MAVPYIATWSAEQTLPARVVHHSLIGIAYAGEMPGDRDENGILWRRVTSHQGQGQPLFGKVHSARQRRAMLEMRCQVCGEPADRTDEGTLWILQDRRADWPRWPENLQAVEPPICLPCARLSRKLCPALRKGAVTVRVGHAPVSGVYGVRYQQGDPFPEAVEDTIVSFTAADARWIVAGQLVRQLFKCAVVDLDAITNTPAVHLPLPE